MTAYAYGRVDNQWIDQDLRRMSPWPQRAGHACVEGPIASGPTKRTLWALAFLHLDLILHLAAWAFFHQSGFLRRPFYSDAP
jgi:hypothetical protein